MSVKNNASASEHRLPFLNTVG